MKKKIMIGILSGAFILGAGTLTFAQTNGGFSFEQMQPYMEKMHPNWSTDEQKEMFEACHGEGGMMENYNLENTNAQNMMNNF